MFVIPVDQLKKVGYGIMVVVVVVLLDILVMVAMQ
jgi:hypothetical protein